MIVLMTKKRHLQDGDVIRYTINVRKLDEDAGDNNIVTLVSDQAITKLDQ